MANIRAPQPPNYPPPEPQSPLSPLSSAQDASALLNSSDSSDGASMDVLRRAFDVFQKQNQALAASLERHRCVFRERFRKISWTVCADNARRS